MSARAAIRSGTSRRCGPSGTESIATRSATTGAARTGRRPYASINFVTAHDGFTLRDLVSYNEKHNEANGENNQDGANDNSSWNSGVEGDTEDGTVNELRLRRQRSLLATLFLSQGVP